MPVTHAVIELLGEAALLLWGVHMVRTGVLRAFGGDLRRVLGGALRGRLPRCLPVSPSPWPCRAARRQR